MYSEFWLVKRCWWRFIRTRNWRRIREIRYEYLQLFDTSLIQNIDFLTFSNLFNDLEFGTSSWYIWSFHLNWFWMIHSYVWWFYFEWTVICRIDSYWKKLSFFRIYLTRVSTTWWWTITIIDDGNPFKKIFLFEASSRSKKKRIPSVKVRKILRIRIHLYKLQVEAQVFLTIIFYPRVVRLKQFRFITTYPY